MSKRIAKLGNAMLPDQRRKAAKYGGLPVVAQPWGWSPLGLDNMTLWLDADDAGTLTLTGDFVEAWGDKSGAGNNFLKPAPNARPQVDVVTINGRRCVSFDGVTHYLQNTGGTTADLVTATAWTIAVALKLGTVTTSDADPTKNDGVLNTATGYLGIHLYDEGANAVSVRGYSWDGNYDSVNYNGGLSTGDTCIAIYRKSGGYINIDCVGGSAAAPSAVADGATTDLTELVSLGRLGAFFGDIDVGEILVWNRELGSREIEMVKLYLKMKWGIS